MGKFSAIFFVICFLGVSKGYPTGAPEEVCDSMTPSHEIEAQTSHFPYSATLSKNSVGPNEKVHIVIKGSEPFKGFLVEVRDENNRAIGKFNVQDNDTDVKPLNCHGAVASAVTHKNADPKESVTLEWTAPSEHKSYTVYATIVQQYDIFWARQSLGSISIE